MVWDIGVASPVIMAEVMLTAHIIKTWSLNCPLGVTETIELMNSLISRTEYKEIVIRWKTARGISNPDQEALLLGCIFLEEPVHMNFNGNIIEKEASGFWRPVTQKPKRPHNAFLIDETGNNKHDKDNIRQGGEKRSHCAARF